MSHTVLIVDDDASQRKTLGMVIVKRLGFKVMEAENGRDAHSIVLADRDKSISMVILDISMPGWTGIETLEKLQEISPGLPVIMVTASKDTQDVVRSMRLGAVDFMTKPVDPDRVLVSLQNGLKIHSLNQEIVRLKKREEGTFGFTDMIGHAGGLKAVVQMASRAAQSNIPVLINGETGVGKEVLARAIHGESPRAGAPFIAVNCGAIPEKLVESTLFGHEKGAFTGAVAKSAGKFREAEGGTIFLDEVGELPPDAQVKLLRVLQQKEVEPVGAGQNIPVNVRVISATNRNLQDEVRAGRFREDLFFRLNVLTMEIPPLRIREDDIASLARHFIERFSVAEGRSIKTISSEALKKLQTYPWPGNVRELENSIHRAMVLSDDSVLRDEDFIFLSAPPRTVNAEKSESHSVVSMFSNPFLNEQGKLKTMDEMETEIIQHAISFHLDNITQAAKDLGIAKSTLYRKMKND